MTRRGAILGFLPGSGRGSPWFHMARNLAILWSGQVLTKLVAFAAMAILARRLSPERYGGVELALGLSAFCWLVIEGGFGSAAVRRLKQHADAPAALAALVPAGQLALALVVAPAMLAYAWFAIDDSGVFHLAVWMAGSIFLLPWKQDWLFQAAGRFDHVVVSQVLRVVLFAALVLGLVSGDERYWMVGAIEFASVGGAALYLMVLQQRQIAPLRLHLSWRQLKGLLREGAPIGAGAVCWAATQFVPLFAIGTMAGMTATAYFGAAHRLGVSLITFSWLYHFNLFPTLAGTRDIGRNFDTGMVRASVRLTAWAGTGLALGLSLAAERVLPLLFGPDFIASAVPFAIIVWTFPLTLVSGHARWLLVASKRSGEMLVSQFAGVVAAVVTSLLLIPYYGAVGGAVGMTAAALAVWIASQLLAARGGTPVPWRPCVLPAVAAGAILVTAGMAAFDPWLEAAAGLTAFAGVALAFDRGLRAIVRALTHGHLQEETSGNGGDDRTEMR